ncbi:hypothetical protein K474DRAFT_1591114 [Panus rudis PR-1116 ss-1]|nr:hypothetical protein K474DRAFT_1591114 [Panus rudis PR-1116 ss-1]
MVSLDVKSLLAPLLYVTVVFGGLYIFSYYYKRYFANRVPEPYFPRHKERDIYVSLLQRTDPPAPEQLLKAALVRRAMTDVQRILRIREDKPAIQVLLQKGSIGDDLLNSIVAAEKELEAEILEVAQEANSFVEGWGQIIFQTATEMLHNERMRSMVEQLPAVRAEKGAPKNCIWLTSMLTAWQRKSILLTLSLYQGNWIQHPFLHRLHLSLLPCPQLPHPQSRPTASLLHRVQVLKA